MANEQRGRGPKVYIPVTLDHYRTGNYQPETIAIIKWTENHNFVLSAMIHSGAWESYRDTIFTSKIYHQLTLTRPLRRKLRISADSSLIRQKIVTLFI